MPPPLASKKQVLRFRSKRSIVSPHANTGSLKIRRKVVMIKVHTNNTRFSRVRGPFPLRIVVMKLNLPTNLDTPAICRLKILKSTEAPLCPSDLSGGLSVHPVPLPPSTLRLINKNNIPPGINQNLNKLSRPYIKSGAAICIGIR